MKKIKITEDQLASVINEIDIPSITKTAQEYDASLKQSEEKFKDGIEKALSINKPISEEKIAPNNLDNSEKNDTFVEICFTKKKIYETVSKFYGPRTGNDSTSN